MLCLIVSLADVFAWQMLFAIWDVAYVIATEEDVIILFCEWQMLLPYDVVEDVIPCYSMLLHITLADVIARWQME